MLSLWLEQLGGFCTGLVCPVVNKQGSRQDLRLFEITFFALGLCGAPSRLEQLFDEYSAYDVDFAYVRGQEMAKLAVALAAAGRHNLIMIGPPGSGKPEDMESVCMSDQFRL